MTTDEKPRLCGGTFFVLVLQALKQRVKARQHYKGERDGLSDPEVLMGLIKVINPEYQEPREGALKGKTNDFKSCKTSTGQYLPFGDTPEIDTFDKRVRERFPDALNAMSIFVDDFLETGTEVQKDVRLVKALLDLIQQDDSIGKDEEFYVSEDGGKIKKAALGGLRKVCLPAFLLGVWHYVVVYRKDNSVGRSTYALSMKEVDENGNDTAEPIVFSEWAFVTGNNMQRKDYRFDKLLAGEYEPDPGAKKKKRKSVENEVGQMNLLDFLPEEKPSDEGEFLTSYIANYRRVQDHGE